MNPFAEDEDASIPLKARNYSNFTDSDDTHSFMDDHDKADAPPPDDDYGTFNGPDSHRPSTQPLMQGSSIQIKKSPILRPQSPNRMNTPIRTDRVTGNRYLRLRSVPIDDDAPGAVLNYEKEVYNSMVCSLALCMETDKYINTHSLSLSMFPLFVVLLFPMTPKWFQMVHCHPLFPSIYTLSPSSTLSL